MTDDAALWTFLAGLRADAIGPASRQHAAALILDHLTCAIVGMNLPWTRTVRSMYAELDVFRPGSGQPAPAAGRSYLGPASRYGGDCPLATTTAAMVNATAGHGLDLDDLYLPAMTHPGAIVIPAAIAIAEATGARGLDLVTAVVAGYECMGRVGQAVGIRNVDHGFHATGQQGPLGSAVAAGRLLGFDAAQLENAVGIAASLGGGIKAFTAGPGMVKRLHAGRAAEAGILAAHATLHGLAGPRHPLTSKFGFVPVFALADPELGGTARPEALTEGLGRSWIVDDIYLKPYAACGALHGAIIAAEQVKAALDAAGVVATPATVAAAVVGSSRRTVDQNSNPDPRDVLSAQYSAEYAVALALRGRVRDASRFLAVEPDWSGQHEDDDVRALARRIEVRVDDRAQAAYPDSNEGSVTVTLTDGRQFARYGVAEAATSQGWAVAEAKFRQTAAPLVGAGAAAEVVAGVRDLLADGDIGAVLTPLRGRLDVRVPA
ncbi:MAG TPA: MmgE/PrpD family protein [Streptosporangiaceae bacterium]|nr:MmgE/PrpD family protein [Streptosporangiaceae bacterium]